MTKERKYSDAAIALAEDLQKTISKHAKKKIFMVDVHHALEISLVHVLVDHSIEIDRDCPFPDVVNILNEIYDGILEIAPVIIEATLEKTG